MGVINFGQYIFRRQSVPISLVYTLGLLTIVMYPLQMWLPVTIVFISTTVLTLACVPHSRLGGSNAPLDDQGIKFIFMRNDVSDMLAFLARIIEHDLHGHVIDDSESR